MTTISQLPKSTQRAYERLTPGSVLCRTVSGTEEAVERGGGYLYTTEPGGRKFPTASGRELIDAGLLSPRHDGLIDDVSQTFEVPQ